MWNALLLTVTLGVAVTGCSAYSSDDLAKTPRDTYSRAVFGGDKPSVDANVPEAAERAGLDVQHRPAAGDDYWLLHRGMGMAVPGFWIRVETTPDPKGGTRVIWKRLMDSKVVNWTLEMEIAERQFLAELSALAYARGSWN